jgi:hypothetical protein
MKIPFTGGCSCGAIRYESNAEPIMMFKCHCRDCQQATGGGFAPGMLLPREAFRFTRGQLRYHFTPSIRRGKHKRGFCPECGSRLTGGEFEKGDSPFIGILAGSLDDSSWFQRPTVGQNGSRHPEVRAVPAAANNRVEARISLAHAWWRDFGTADMESSSSPA